VRPSPPAGRARISRGRGGGYPVAAVACWLLLALAFVVAAPALAEPKFPELTGRIVDSSRLLTPEDRTAIEAELAELEEKSTDQLVVVTLPSLQGYEIEDFGYQLGRKWGIGQAGKNNGVLLIVAPNERKVRIEIGRGLEGDMTDLMSKLIIENAILPAFRRGDFSGGIRAGVRDIKAVLLGDAEGVKERAKGAKNAPGADTQELLLIAFWIAVLLFAIRLHYRQAQAMPQSTQSSARRSRRGRSGRDGVIVPPSDWGSGSGNWDGGSNGGWSGGGGGDFGGGGGSGSW